MYRNQNYLTTSHIHVTALRYSPDTNLFYILFLILPSGKKLSQLLTVDSKLAPVLQQPAGGRGL